MSRLSQVLLGLALAVLAIVAVIALAVLVFAVLYLLGILEQPPDRALGLDL